MQTMMIVNDRDDYRCEMYICPSLFSNSSAAAAVWNYFGLIPHFFYFFFQGNVQFGDGKSLFRLLSETAHFMIEEIVRFNQISQISKFRNLRGSNDSISLVVDLLKFISKFIKIEPSSIKK